MGILIVDDEQDIRDTLAEFLADAGYEVQTAADGAAAMKALTDAEVPCVVVLDLAMPVLSGNEVITRMQQSARLAAVPIIITTSDPSRAPRGLPIMKKPIDLRELLAAVEARCPDGRRKHDA